MEAIGIKEQEVMEYTDAREKGTENMNAAPNFSDFYSDPISPDNLSTFKELDERLEALEMLVESSEN